MLPWWWAAVIVVVVVAGGAVAMWLLGVWRPMPPTVKDPDQLRLDRIKTALTVAAGLAAGATLLMTLRRQMSSERAQRFAESEALEQRSTALYVAAADQLGSDKAAVRLAGLYALERLGQDNVKLRQTVVDVWCAYLRMPYVPPVEVRRRNNARSPEYLSADQEAPDVKEEAERQQELQVRLTAQRLLAAHLGPELAGVHWLDAKDARMVIDLVGAVLVDFSLDGCEVGRSSFSGAQFHGRTDMVEAQFHDVADLHRVQFHGNANLMTAQFHSHADLRGAQFHGLAYLGEAQFHGLADLREVQFRGDALLPAVQFHNLAQLAEVQFHGYASLAEAQFHVGADLAGAQFHSDAYLRETQFHGAADLQEAQVYGDTDLRGAQFHDYAYLSRARFHGVANLGDVRFSQEVDLSQVAVTSRAVLPQGWTLPRGGLPPDRLRLVRKGHVSERGVEAVND
nr:hypothetical protein GCM10020063_001950 [Dactylosporangium thailandense]